MKKHLGLLAVFGALLAVSIAACAFLGLAKKPARPFNHKVHVQDQQMECVACHAKAGQEDKVAMPASLKKCMTCHEGGDEKKPPERKLAALYPGEKPEWSAVTAVGDDVIFSHKTHTEKKVACNECHKGIETSAGVDESLRVTMDDCMKCHSDRGLSTDCATCHKTNRREVPPGSHALSWKETHGRIVRAGVHGPIENRCSLCHAESQCVQCHQDEAPRGHTNFWRIQGHAVEAGTNRSACATCHRTDFCDRCHQETEPRSHVGSWADPQNRHCVSCHLPVNNEKCYACHKGTPSHNAAPTPPASVPAHAYATSCLTCHLTVEKVTHPYTGDGSYCRTCHK